MSDVDYVKIEGEAFQEVANGTAEMIWRLMHGIHSTNAEIFEMGQDHGDAGPVVVGAIGGIVQFLVGGSDKVTDEEVRRVINEAVDHILPQVRIGVAAQKAGSVGEGTA